VYNLGNGGPDADQRAVVDAGFLELPRLGILPDDDPDVTRSLAIVDDVLRRGTDSGDGFYRYGTATDGATRAGTEDGYGDCFTGDATDCTVQGKPWAGECGSQPQNKGSGHLWPALAAERAQHLIETSGRAAATPLLTGMAATASGVGLIPEQVWENADLPASPWGTPAECASIGFENGQAAGSASPLTWSAASYVRLAAAYRAGTGIERPTDTIRRYLGTAPGLVPLTITGPAEGALVNGSTTVTGTTAPGATVDLDAVNTDIDGAATRATTRAGADGTFSASLAVPPGTVTITATATIAGRPDATGFAQRSVVYDVVPGTLLFAADDPDGDDNGPGTYAYPTAADFRPGAYDVQRLEIYDSGPETVTFRVRTRDLSPTFGSPLGAQLLDLYLTNPSGGATSTAASFPQRNHTLATGWNRLLEVQGFGQRFVDGTGATVGSLSIRATAVTRWITVTTTKSALGGTPGTGWSVALVLTGQDGFSADQARGFTQPAQGYQFGVCTAAAVAAGNPICAVDPGTVPKAVDILTPADVAQATVLDPRNPVSIPALPLG
jgi:hypothetical protein